MRQPSELAGHYVLTATGKQLPNPLFGELRRTASERFKVTQNGVIRQSLCGFPSARYACKVLTGATLNAGQMAFPFLNAIGLPPSTPKTNQPACQLCPTLPSPDRSSSGCDQYAKHWRRHRAFLLLFRSRPLTLSFETNTVFALPAFSNEGRHELAPQLILSDIHQTFLINLSHPYNPVGHDTLRRQIFKFGRDRLIAFDKGNNFYQPLIA